MLQFFHSYLSQSVLTMKGPWGLSLLLPCVLAQNKSLFKPGILDYGGWVPWYKCATPTREALDGVLEKSIRKKDELGQEPLLKEEKAGKKSLLLR